MPRRLSGAIMAIRTVIVTGAASGIGLACIEGLLADGYSVAALDIVPLPESLRSVRHGDRLLPVAADVTLAEDCARAVANTVAAFGRLDGLVHMAAIHSTRTWRELDAPAFNRVLEVNVTGSFLMASAAAEYMAAHGGGAIVLASSGSISVSGVGGDGRGGPAYVTSKAAIIGLTRSLARSLGCHGIRVNAVSPGSTDTPMIAGYSAEARRGVGERTALGRIGRPEEIAAVVRFLISDAAGYMTGEIVNVNGGGSFG